MSNYVIVDGELYHHGVKGMKWGVRRAQKKAAKKAAKAQKKWERKVYENWTDPYNKADSKVNSRLKDLNAKYDDINFNDKSKAKRNRKYVEEYCKMWNDIYTKELESAFGKAPIEDGRKWCERVPFFMDPVEDYREMINYKED